MKLYEEESFFRRPLFLNDDKEYKDKVAKEISKITDMNRKRNKHIIYIVPNPEVIKQND